MADRAYLDMQDIIHKHTSQLGPDSICHRFDLPLHSSQKHGVHASFEALEHLYNRLLCRNCTAG